MSDSLALVRFPDGDLRVAYYFGSMDMVVQPLYDLAEADAVMEGRMERVLNRLSELEHHLASELEVEDVDVWSAYGNGVYWRGRASREHGLLVEGIDPHGQGAEAPREVLHGTPDWVPADWRD